MGNAVQSVATEWLCKCRPNQSAAKRDRFERAGTIFSSFSQRSSASASFVQPDHRVIVSTHDEQRRRLHTRQRVTREIGPSAARDYGIDPLPDFGRSVASVF
jgi:hypothetical protein